MTVQEQIKHHINEQPEPKRSDMQTLHEMMLELMPSATLWFMDGKNSDNKAVYNPNIGYGHQILKYADGKTKDFYQIGISANKTGISIYILGLKDKNYLAETYGDKIGKANVTSYCIKFKALKDINLPILKEAIQYGIQNT